MPVKNFFLFLYFSLFSLTVSGQYVNTKTIDTLITNKIIQLRKEGKITEALELSETILKKANEIGYEKGIKEIYYIISNILSVMGRRKESMEFLNHLLPMLTETKDPELLMKAYTEYGRNYNALGLFDQAITYYEKAKYIGKLSWGEPATRQRLMDYLYANEAVLYEEKGDMRLFLISLQNAYLSRPTPIVASRIAKYYTIHMVKLDSAAYYLALADSLYATGKFDIHQNAIILRNRGRYWVSVRQFQKAYTDYEQSVAISETGNKSNDARDTYKLMYEAYALEGNIEKSNFYFKKYSVINDSIQRAHRLLIEIPVNKILNQQKEASRRYTRQLYTIAIVLALLTGSAWFYTHKTLRRKKKEKEEEAKLLNKKVHESYQQLSAKQQETEQLYQEMYKSAMALEQKEQETVQLQQKVNESFNELIQLGRDNHPNFYARFRELYPELHRQLLEICPRLRLSELTLCAYIYLDFTSKDISEYTFKSVRTVQTRKSDLRKKLNIDSSIDIYIWIKQLAQA